MLLKNISIALLILASACAARAVTVSQFPAPVALASGAGSISTVSNVTSGHTIIFMTACSSSPTFSVAPSDGVDTFTPSSTTLANAAVISSASGGVYVNVFTETASTTRAETVSLTLSSTYNCNLFLWETTSVARFALLGMNNNGSSTTNSYTSGTTYINSSITNGIVIACGKTGNVTLTNASLTSFQTAVVGSVNRTGCGYTTVTSITAASPFTTTYTNGSSSSTNGWGFVLADAPAAGGGASNYGIVK